MITIEQAYQSLAQAALSRGVGEGSDTVLVERSLGRVLAGPAICNYDSPPFDQSAMDGVAFKLIEDRDAYAYVGAVAAGDEPKRVELKAGECVRIMTGAPVPETADTVQMIEKIEIDHNIIRLKERPSRGAHIRRMGENVKKGDPLFKAGLTITPAILAALISQGVHSVAVRRRLRVGVAATGNEIVDHRRPLSPGQIYNSNSPSLHAMLESPSVEIVPLGLLPDHLERTADCLAHNSRLDALALTGGVSMGDFDLVPEAAKKAGFRQIFHKVQMKPGKPIWFGAHQDGAFLFGLPGNPVSALVGAALFVQPTLQALLRGFFRKPRWLRAIAAEPIANRRGLTLYFPARMSEGDLGLEATPVHTSGSGDIVRFAGLQALAKLPPKSSVDAGQELQILLPFSQQFG